jgi:hypothetical protein
LFKETWEFIKTLVVGAKDIVNGALEAIVGLLTGDLQGALKGLKTMWQGWSDIVNGAMQALLGIIEAILPGFQQAVQDIIDAVSELPGKLKQWGIDAIQGFVDGIKERWEALRESALSIFDFSGVSAGSAGRRLGRDLSEGMSSGIDEGSVSVGSAARRAARDAEDAARDESDTRSPSRKWMEIGRDLMAGLGIGIKNNTRTATDAVRQGVNEMGDSLEGLGQKATQTADRFGSMVAGLIAGSRKIGGVLSRLGERLLSSGISGLASAIAPGLFSGGGIFAGLFDKGGMIPAGQFGVVGERGPEIVTGPARVTSRADTARMMGGGQPARVEVVARVENGSIVQDVQRIAGPLAVEITQQGLQQYDRKTLPARVKQISGDPRVKY